MDLAAFLPRWLRPYRYNNVRQATFQRARLGTTVTLFMKPGPRVTVRVRHETAEALLQALAKCGVLATEEPAKA
jgi:hypothetical protein